MKSFRLLATTLSFLLAYSATATPLSGTLTIGPTGNYLSIGAAIADIQGQTLGGALTLELQSTYVSSVETYPIVFSNLTTTAVNTLTLRPQTGAVGLAISSATNAATVDLNGAQFLTLDGRPGGTGAAKQLTIANTDSNGVALRFINEASSNVVRYLTLQGVSTNIAGGVVLFSTTTGANGNDNNTIATCNIRDGTTTPVNGLYALGTTNTLANNNSGNLVTNCNIFNFYAAAAVDSAGVRLDDGNTDWTLAGNSFYQTNSSRAAVAASVRAIYINNTNSGNNFIVTGNFIGGSTTNACGAKWTTTGTAATYQFVGIQFNVGTTTPSSVQGNIISNMVWTSAVAVNTLPGVWIGIDVDAGSVNVGNVTGNIIGSGSGTGSVAITTSGNGGTSFGIGSRSSGTVTIANNTIGSITAIGSGNTVASSLVGIQVIAGTNLISGNIVGSSNTVNSLNAATSSSSGSGQQVTGIRSSSTVGAAITNNTIANLNNNYVGNVLSGQILGIFTSAGVNTIIGNTVRNLSTTSQLSFTPAITTSQSVFGILQVSATAGQTVSQNIVHSLANTAPAANVGVCGIYFSGATNGTNVIARNLVHSLAVSSTSAASVVHGMLFVTGTFTAQNNMVRVGLDAGGAGTAGASSVRGIFDGGTTAGRNFYHNSVYVCGTQTSGASSSYTFFSGGASNLRDFRNNIFINARSNSGATGTHYAAYYSGTGVNPAGLTSGGNIFLASGTGGVLGHYNGADLTNLAAWQAATGQDATSLNTDPLFINPTGTSATVDLHIPTNSPANNAGLPIGVTDDFDGELRSLSTPDIGADETPVTNHDPVAGNPFTLVAELGVSTTVAIIGGANAPTDADNDVLIITQVTSGPNGVVRTDGTNVIYTAMSGSMGSFTYTVSDGHDGTASQTISVTITPSTIPGYNQIAASSFGSGTNVLTFLGTPAFNYALDLTTNLVPPIAWQPQVTNPAAANGWIIFTNVTSGSPVFYRTRFAP